MKLKATVLHLYVKCNKKVTITLQNKSQLFYFKLLV